jgi:3D (Asp-Asp-Asp) domain-containing protein
MREAAERQGMTLELVSDEAVVSEDSAEPVAEGDAAGDVFNPDTAIRYFNGRAVRPVRTITMLVTAYSPDERSCGDSADGITSSIHNVWTNGMNLVAADSRVLPLGSMVSIPGYDEGRIVPVLDRGGAIKGNRLDVLFSSHDTALRWGSRRLKITVWGPADGQPADDYRRFRDSRD